MCALKIADSIVDYMTSDSLDGSSRRWFGLGVVAVAALGLYAVCHKAVNELCDYVSVRVMPDNDQFWLSQLPDSGVGEEDSCVAPSFYERAARSAASCATHFKEIQRIDSKGNLNTCAALENSARTTPTRDFSDVDDSEVQLFSPDREVKRGEENEDLDIGDVVDAVVDASGCISLNSSELMGVPEKEYLDSSSVGRRFFPMGKPPMQLSFNVTHEFSSDRIAFELPSFIRDVFPAWCEKVKQLLNSRKQRLELQGTSQLIQENLLAIDQVQENLHTLEEQRKKIQSALESSREDCSVDSYEWQTFKQMYDDICVKVDRVLRAPLG